MPKYTNGTHVIHASQKAYELFYKERGYKLVEVKKEPQAFATEPIVDDLESYEVVEEQQTENISLDFDSNIPIIAQLNMLSYDELKAKGKELGISGNIKREKLIDMILDALA